jgi:UDP-glucose 4-epimerase
MAGKVISRSESASKIRLIPYEEAYGPGFEELGRRVPNITALTSATGWQPSRSIDETIDDVIAYEQNEARGGERDEASFVQAWSQGGGRLRVAR